MTLRNGLLAGGVALLAVVAAVGWSRKPSDQSQPVQPVPVQTATYYDANGQPVYGAAPAPAAAYVNGGEADRQTYYRTDERYYEGSRRPVRVVHHYQYAAAPAPVREREY